MVGLGCIDKKLFFKYNKEHVTIGHLFKLTADAPRLDTARYFFAFQITRVRNILSSKAVSSTLLPVFKGNLLLEDLSEFLTLDTD